MKRGFGGKSISIAEQLQNSPLFGCQLRRNRQTTHLWVPVVCTNDPPAGPCSVASRRVYAAALTFSTRRLKIRSAAKCDGYAAALLWSTSTGPD